MALPHALRQMLDRPGLYLASVTFDTTVAFIDGFNLASNGGVLLGFREWLVTKLGDCNTLHWSALVLRLTFPDVVDPRDCLREDEGQKRALEAISALLDEYWQERASLHGLRGIYLRHYQWMKQQDWYKPSSPYYVDEM